MKQWLESLQHTLRCYIEYFGYGGLAIPVFDRMCKSIGRQVEVSLYARSLSTRLHIRLGSSDLAVLYHVLFNSEYEWDMPIWPRVIIDAGVNIGMASVFYATKYPDAQIYAIEPVHSNFDLLRKNTERYTNVVAVKAALWKENTMLDTFDPGRDAWGYQTVLSSQEGTIRSQQSVEGTTLDSLMDRFDIDYVDILKVDIEGAEAEVFGASASWIGKVGLIIAELHDWIKEGCSDSFYEATRDFESQSQTGEKTVKARRGYFRGMDVDHGSTSPGSASRH